jgi:hypothetical protein
MWLEKKKEWPTAKYLAIGTEEKHENLYQQPTFGPIFESRSL